MTTGDKTSTTLRAVSTTAGPGQIGYYKRRVWNGANSAVVSKTRSPSLVLTYKVRKWQPPRPSRVYWKLVTRTVQSKVVTVELVPKTVYITKKITRNFVTRVPVRINGRLIFRTEVRSMSVRERVPVTRLIRKAKVTYVPERVTAWVRKVTKPKPGRYIYVWKRRVVRGSVKTVRALSDNPYTTDVLEYRDSLFSGLRNVGYAQSPDLREANATMLNWFGGPALYNTEWTPGDQLKLLAKLRDKVGGSDFNAGVFLAEGGKSLAMVKEAVITLAGSIRALKRGDIATAAKWLRSNKSHAPLKKAPVGQELSNRWLELQYGWLPLVKDIHGAGEHIAHLTLTPRLARTVRVRHSRKVPSFWDSTPGYRNVGFSSTLSRSIIAKISEVDYPQFVGLTDPASIAWELLPYSFVADWLIPFSQFLSARSLAHALTAQYVVTTYRRTTWSGCRFTERPKTWDQYQTWIDFDQEPFHYKALNVSREVTSNLDVPTPRFKPLADVPSWKRLLNAVALFDVAFRKPR